jgi:chitinase
VSAIKAEYLTHVNYAFAGISEDGRVIVGDPCLDVGACPADANPHVAPGGNFAALRRLKQQHPQLRTLIAVGGWGGSSGFSDAAVTPESRRQFVESLVNTFFIEHKGVFDGVDIDWEYPVGGGMAGNRNRPEDRGNYTLLLADLRRALDERSRIDGRKYLLTIAAGAGRAHVRNLDVPMLARILDFINVMTYDYHSGGAIAHFNAPLDTAQNDPTPEFNARASVEAFLAAGLPAEKLVLGVPFYGYGYAGVAAANNGRFQPGTTRPDTSAPNPWAGALRYYRVVEAQRAGFTRYWDAEARVPWLYHAATRTWITYDDAESLALKAEFVRTRKLGGIMIWELSGDDGTLLPAIYNGLIQRRN